MQGPNGYEVPGTLSTCAPLGILGVSAVIAGTGFLLLVRPVGGQPSGRVRARLRHSATLVMRVGMYFTLLCVGAALVIWLATKVI